MCYEELRQLYAATAKERDESKKQLAGVTEAFRLLTEKFEAVSAERDAAVADLGTLLDNCKVCRHQHDAPADCDCECLECKRPCFCKDFRDGSEFEWRGMEEQK